MLAQVLVHLCHVYEYELLIRLTDTACMQTFTGELFVVCMPKCPALCMLWDMRLG